MKEIVIDLNKGDFSDLIQGLELQQEWLIRKTDELAKRLADLSVSEMQNNFMNVLYDGPLDITIEPVEHKGNGEYVVKAGGSAILFVEFGTGVHFPDDHPEQQFARGSYGKGLGKNDYWFYTGQPGNAGGTLATDPKTGRVRLNTTITHGNPANKPVYEAMKEAEFRLREIALEVFSSD